MVSSMLTFTFYGSQKKRYRQGAENVFEDLIAEYFPNLGEERDIQVQESQII